jgi:hypothetical protein
MSATRNRVDVDGDADVIGGYRYQNIQTRYPACAEERWFVRSDHHPDKAVTVTNFLTKVVTYMYVCPVCQYEGLEAKPYETWPPPQGLELRPPYQDHLGRPSYESMCPEAAGPW